MIKNYIDHLNKDTENRDLKSKIKSNRSNNGLSIGHHMRFINTLSVHKHNLFEDHADLFQIKNSVIEIYKNCALEVFMYDLYLPHLEDALIKLSGDIIEKNILGEEMKHFKNEMDTYRHSFKDVKMKRYDVLGTMAVSVAIALFYDFLDEVVEP